MGDKARKKRHDGIAIPMVAKIFGNYGFTGFTIGTENDSKELSELLQTQSDPTSIMLRFRPDQIFVRPMLRSVLVEVKSEEGKYPNYAIEMDSHVAAHLWNQQSDHVVYVFVDTLKQTCRAIWAHELPDPHTIYVPLRWDFDKQEHRIQTEWPGAEIKAIPWNKDISSGKPFMVISKKHAALRDLEQFIKSEIIGEHHEIL